MKTAVITGANRGIGLEFCKQFKERNHHVIAVCRKASKELRELEVQIEEGVDVTSSENLQMLSNKIEGTVVDFLINSAGIMKRTSWPDLEFTVIREEIEVNALGPLMVTKAFMPRLGEGSKIAMITSRMGSIADNTSGGAYGYRMSKVALNMASVSLAQDIKHLGIPVAILHPGYVKTDMTGHTGHLSPSESVKGMLERIDQLNIENTGQFWHSNGELLPW